MASVKLLTLPEKTSTSPKIISQMLGLFMHHYLSNNRHVQAFFVRDSRSRQVNVELVALFLWLRCYVPVRHIAPYQKWIIGNH